MIITSGSAMGSDPLATFIDEVEGSLSRLKKALAENPLPCGSRALAFAMQAGYPPRMAYTVNETARYMGVNADSLYAERDAGRLRFIMPEGKKRGARIAVDEVDRWLDEEAK